MIRNHERSGAGRMVARRALGLLAIATAIALSLLTAQASAPQVVATIDVGSGYDVAITPNGAFAYVPNGDVYVIDTSSNTVVHTVAMPSVVTSNIAITPNGAFAYVVGSPDGQDQSVYVIDTSSNTVTGAPIHVGNGQAGGIAITPNGAFVYVVNNNDSTVSVIDTSSNTVTNTVTVGDNPSGIAITPNGAFAYVTSQGDNTVRVIDTSSNTVTGVPIPVGNAPVGIAITPNGAFAYVTNKFDSTVSVIDTSTNTVTGPPISVGSIPVDVAITPNGAFAYVVNFSDSTVSVIDTSSNTVTNTVTVVGNPYDVAITPNNAFAYVTNQSNQPISVISTGIPPAATVTGGGSKNQPPTVTVVQPNGGESMNAGSSYSVVWSSGGTGISSYTLSFSSDGGATWDPVASGITNNYYTWTVPSTATSNGLVRVEAVGASGTVLASDTSNGNFTIVVPASPNPPPTEPATSTPPVPPARTHDYDPAQAAANTTSIDDDLGLVAIANPLCTPGTAFRGTRPAVFYCGIDGKRYAFPNTKTWFTWFPDFNNVQFLTNAQVAAVPLATKYVPYRPGVRMLKLQTNFKVYVVDRRAVLRLVPDEQTASDLYGANWNTKIDDVAAPFWSSYTIGQPIN